MSTLQMQWYIYALQEMEFAAFLAGAPDLKFARWKMFLIVCACEMATTLPFIPVWDASWVMVVRGFLMFLVLYLVARMTISSTKRWRGEIVFYLFLATIFADLLATLMLLGLQRLQGISGIEQFLDNVVRIGSDGRLFGGMLYNVNFMGIGNIFLTFYQQIERGTRWRMVWMLLLLTVSQDVLLIGMILFSVEALREYFLFYAAGTVVLSVASIYFVYRTLDGAVEAMNNKRELEQLKLRQDMDYRYYQLAQSSAAQMSAFRHDFRNQLQVAYAVAKQDPTQATELLEQLEARLNQTRQVGYCENPIVNVLLSLKKEEARKAGFEMEIRASVGQWRMTETDLTSLFSNLLDNAIDCPWDCPAAPRQLGAEGGKWAVCHVGRPGAGSRRKLINRSGGLKTGRDKPSPYRRLANLAVGAALAAARPPKREP